MVAGKMDTIRKFSKTCFTSPVTIRHLLSLMMFILMHLGLQLLDLLSDKPIAGGLKAPLEKEATVPLPSSGPVQWEFNLL